MNLKIIGEVNYKEEVNALINKITVKPKIENRGTFFKRQRYNVYFSHDGKYSLAFKYKGSFHWGSTFYNLILESRKNGKITVKKDFGNRIFICDFYRSNYPWAESRNKFYLLEIEDRIDNKSSNFIKVYDADNNIETVVAENGLSILSWSKNATYIMYMIYNKDDTVDVAISNLDSKRTVNINDESGYYLRFAFFDKEEKYNIAIEQAKQNKGIILIKIFTLLDVNLVYSQEIDLRKINLQQVLPEKKFLGFLIKESVVFRADTSSFTVEFDKDNNVLYFGMNKEGESWGLECYERLLWFKAELEL